MHNLHLPALCGPDDFDAVIFLQRMLSPLVSGHHRVVYGNGCSLSVKFHIILLHQLFYGRCFGFDRISIYSQIHNNRLFKFLKSVSRTVICYNQVDKLFK